ncbi:MAG: hypothetical protein JOZ10_00770 [Acidobacteria bacterium]|nr:hypothetical protein [Acidobacteriota bacterium]MBV9144893.1 hypothetical protein [Acidobacteriota bacterium]MBV9435306.1 hypothetical protein [Acidobacteriota bacterium]
MKRNISTVSSNCGNTHPPELLSEAVVERMKMVFRSTHGTEMTKKDRDYLGIPPCSGECCPSLD